MYPRSERWKHFATARSERFAKYIVGTAKDLEKRLGIVANHPSDDATTTPTPTSESESTASSGAAVTNCHAVEPSRACECAGGRNAKCLRSISRDVRRVGCEVAAQGNRTVADIDLLRRQILAQLAKIETSLACLAGTPITARDINGAPNAQFVITKPGHYCLAENVVAVTRTPFVPIVIMARDVTLDLGSFVLESFPGGTAQTLPPAAIEIVQSQNVTVRNGSIRGFATSVEILSSDLVTLQGLRMLQWSFDASFTAPMLRLRAFGTAVMVSIARPGMPAPSNITIRQCSFDQGRGAGITVSGIEGLVVEDCLVANLLSQPQPFGMPPTASEDTMAGIQVFGINIPMLGISVTASNVTLRRVLVEHLIEVPSRSDVVAFMAIGIDLETDAPDATFFERNLLLEDVVVQDVRSPANLLAMADLIRLLGNFNPAVPPDLGNAGPRGCVLRRCVARDLQLGGVPTDVGGTRMILVEGESVLLEDCVVQQAVYAGPADGNANLFGYLVHNRGVRLRNCVATGIDTTASTRPAIGSNATGFLTCDCGLTGGLVEGCYAAEVRVGSNRFGPLPLTAGFLVFDTRQTLFRGNVANRNAVGFRTVQDPGSPFFASSQTSLTRTRPSAMPARAFSTRRPKRSMPTSTTRRGRTAAVAATSSGCRRARPSSTGRSARRRRPRTS